MTNEEQQMDEDNNYGEWKLVQGGHGKCARTKDGQPNADAAEMEASPSTGTRGVGYVARGASSGIKIKIKNTCTRSSILITRDEMTINLLESLDNIRGKKCHSTAWNMLERAVPTC